MTAEVIPRRRVHPVIALRNYWLEENKVDPQDPAVYGWVRIFREWYQGLGTPQDRLELAEIAAEVLGLELDLQEVEEPGSAE